MFKTRLATIALALAIPAMASAHGIWAHVHVTAWAIENLPPGELRDFFADPEVFNAALFGAAFTDSGYFPQAGDLATYGRAYTEHTHWEPFIESYIAYMLEHYPPPYDTREDQLRAAFVIGAACHGLQDEVFDSLFLYQIEAHDGAGQDAADPGTDGFFVVDDYVRFVPEVYIPTEILVPIYQDVDPHIDASVIERSVDAQTGLYLNDGLGIQIAEAMSEEHAEALTWTRAHYLDPDIPGSLRAEILPTGAYIEALWERLNGRWESADPVVFVYPLEPRPLRGADPGHPDSWVTFVFGAGVENGSSTVAWEDADGNPVAHSHDDTRWQGAGWSRIHRVMPDEALIPSSWYTVTYEAGATLVTGETSTVAHPHTFQVACDEATAEACEPIEVPPEPELTRAPDEPEPDDVGPTDTGMDTGMDTGIADPDAGDLDAEPDAGEPDTEPDAGAADTGVGDTGQDTSAPEPTPIDEGEDTSGCGCGETHARRASGAWLALIGVLAAVRRRRT